MAIAGKNPVAAVSNTPGPAGPAGTDGIAPPSWAIAATRGSDGKDMLVTAGGNGVTVHRTHRTRTRTNLRLLYDNYYVSTDNGDTVPNVTLTVAASVLLNGLRYPAFSPTGATTISIPPGARDVPLDVTVILPPDTQFTVTTWVSTSNSSVGIPWNYQQNASPEINDYASTNPGDKSRGATITAGSLSSVGASIYGPGGLISLDAERGASVAILGDSIGEGVGDGAFHRGWVQRGLDTDVPWVVLTRGGERLQTMAANSRFRLAKAAACGATHVVLVAGTNDLQGDRTLAQMQTDVTTIARAYRAAGMKVIACRVPPLTDGSWGSDGTQTIRADWVAGGQAEQYHAWLDTQVTSGLLLAVWDPNPYLRSATDPRKWAPGNTGDGIHPTSAGAASAAAAVNRAILLPPAPAAGSLPVPTSGNTLGALGGLLTGYEAGTMVYYDAASAFGSLDLASTPAVSSGSFGSGLQILVFNPNAAAGASPIGRVSLADLGVSGGSTGGGSTGTAMDTAGLLAYYRPGPSRATLDLDSYSGNPAVPGGRVLLLDDASGNSRALTEADPNLAPILVAAAGGNPAAVRFGGTPFQRLTNFAGLNYMALNQSDLTWVVAFRTPATLASGNNMVTWLGRMAQDDGKCVIATTFGTGIGATIAFGRFGPSGGGVVSHSVAVQPNTKYIVIATSNYATRALDLQVNGVNAATVTGTAFGVAPDWDRHQIGAERYASDNFSGDVSEHRLYGIAKSTTARDAIYQDLLARIGS